MPAKGKKGENTTRPVKKHGKEKVKAQQRDFNTKVVDFVKGKQLWSFAC